MNKGIWAVVIVLLLGVAVVIVVRKQQSETASSGGSAATQGSSMTIAVIPKGTTHQYWKSVEAVQSRRARISASTSSTKDRCRRMTEPARFPSSSSLPPTTSTESCWLPWTTSRWFRPSRRRWPRKSPSSSSTHLSTAWRAKTSSATAARIMRWPARWAEINWQKFSAERESMFCFGMPWVGQHHSAGGRILLAMKENPGMTPLVTNRYAGTSVSEAKATALDLLDQIRQANGIFCPNESTTIGMLDVLEENNLAGKIHFVGFDATPELVTALRKGELDAIVSQNPKKMAYEGVKACLGAIRGDAQPPDIDSGVQLITRGQRQFARGAEAVVGWLMQISKDFIAGKSVPRLRMQGVRKRFGATVALDGVDLSVESGEDPGIGRRERGGEKHAHESPFRSALRRMRERCGWMARNIGRAIRWKRDAGAWR